MCGADSVGDIFCEAFFSFFSSLFNVEMLDARIENHDYPLNLGFKRYWSVMTLSCTVSTTCIQRYDFTAFYLTAGVSG